MNPVTSAVAVLCVLVCSVVYAGEPLEAWPHGAAGYQQSLQQATESEQPLVVLFHGTKCAFSRRFIAEYLPDTALQAFLASVPKAEVAPETGDVEKSIVEQDYGITSFPTIVVAVPAFNTKARKLNPLRKNEVDWTPARFLREVKSAIAECYDEKAYSLDKTREYEKALVYLQTALRYDPENLYANKASGSCYLALAQKKQDRSLLIQAEAAFTKALQLDPADKHAAGALAALQRLK